VSVILWFILATVNAMMQKSIDSLMGARSVTLVNSFCVGKLSVNYRKFPEIFGNQNIVNLLANFRILPKLSC
jgi:hypothetical protein